MKDMSYDIFYSFKHFIFYLCCFLFKYFLYILFFISFSTSFLSVINRFQSLQNYRFFSEIHVDDSQITKLFFHLNITQ